MIRRYLAALIVACGLQAGSPDGTTELHRASEQDDVQAAARLIKGGANTKAANRYGITPLWIFFVVNVVLFV